MNSMKLQNLQSFSPIRLFSVLSISLLGLSACDIVPVSVGTWDIAIESDAGTNTARWIITDVPSLTITGNSDILVSEIDLAGSRITWSSDAFDLGAAGESQRVNFRGTVDGDRLAGTVFTQQGNFTVTGNRQ